MTFSSETKSIVIGGTSGIGKAVAASLADFTAAARNRYRKRIF